ncbi:MAG: 16S rRNA (uracil(1498)-N(3))-methyltransferase [Micrococcales bacterium]
MVEPMFWSEFKTEPVVGSRLELGGSEGKHAATVRRMRVSEPIQLTNGKGIRVRGSVVELLPKSLIVEVAEVKHETLASDQITLIQALAKGDRDELAIQAATELGAAAVIPWQAERSISRWDAAKSTKGQARWQLICDEAAKQSLRTFFPVVSAPMSSNDIVANINAFEKFIILDPTAELGLASIQQLTGKIALVVGPEGGISDEELSLFEKSGAIRAHLGDSILRTSTAGVAAIAAIQALTGYYN